MCQAVSSCHSLHLEAVQKRFSAEGVDPVVVEVLATFPSGDGEALGVPGCVFGGVKEVKKTSKRGW